MEGQAMQRTGAGTILAVAGNRMSQVVGMHAYLVLASGVEARSGQACSYYPFPNTS